MKFYDTVVLIGLYGRREYSDMIFRITS